MAGTGSPLRAISPVLDPSLFEHEGCRLEIVGGYGGKAQVVAHRDFGAGYPQSVNLGHCIMDAGFALLGAFATEGKTTFVVGRQSSHRGDGGERREDRAILVFTVASNRRINVGVAMSFSDYDQGWREQFATEVDSVRENPGAWVLAHTQRFDA